MAYTRGQFAKECLQRWRAPVTIRNRVAMQSWMRAEGDAAKFNCLNSTHDAPGATVFNSASVKNYVSFEQGVEMTVETLNYGADRGESGYRPIRTALLNNRPARETLKRVEESSWGTGGLGLIVRATTLLALKLYEHHRIVQ